MRLKDKGVGRGVEVIWKCREELALGKKVAPPFQGEGTKAMSLSNPYVTLTGHLRGWQKTSSAFSHCMPA